MNAQAMTGESTIGPKVNQNCTQPIPATIEEEPNINKVALEEHFDELQVTRQRHEPEQVEQLLEQRP